MMEWLVSLLLLLATSCMVADAVKRYQLKPEADEVFEAWKKDVDQFLKLMETYTEASVESPPIGCDSNSQCSKSVKDDLKLVWESSPRNVDGHRKLDVYASTVPPGTTGYTKGKHLESSSTTGNTNEFHSTTAVYSKEKNQTVESTTKSSQSGFSTTAVPPRDPMQVGSISGIPGVNYPDYSDIPVTSFTCSDKSYLPGFYADLEAGCQVFHVCWPNRRESFLCPLGTTFNQAILACDYWYSTDCSLAPHYYNVNAENSPNNESQLKNISLSSMINDLLEKGVVDSVASTVPSTGASTNPDAVLSFISKFLPVKAKVTIYPETTGKRARIVASSSIGNEKIVFGSSKKNKLPPKPQHSHSKIPVSRPTSTPEVPADDPKHRFEAYEIAIKITIDRFLEALLRLTEVKLPYSSQSPKPKKKLLEVVPEDFKEFDLAAKRLFDGMFEKLKQFLQKPSKPDDVSNAKEPVTEKYTPTPKPSEPVTEKHIPTAKPTESTKVRKPYVLTQLNPRFIVKPVTIPKKELGENSTPHPTKSSPVMPTSAVRVVKIRYPHKIPLKSVPYSGKNISPGTKRALIENYMRLLKVRSG